MGQSKDFSEGIKIIQEAHADALGILQMWRDFMEAPGEITVTVRNPDKITSEVTLPTIREAINRYLGGVFDQITLARKGKTVVIRLDAAGNVELIDGDGTRANLAAGTLVASRISGADGELLLDGNVNFENASISKGYVQNLSVSAATISDATFSGDVSVSGGTSITGDAFIHNATVQNLSTGTARYRKQVMKWGVEGAVDNEISGPASGGLWKGDVKVLEKAGIFPEPTWSDCIYVPETLAATMNTVNIYWGTPEEGLIPIQDALHVTTDLSTRIMALWPYKMYEKVDDGYRIRWLPLQDQHLRVMYARSGDMTVQEGQQGLMLPLVVRDIVSPTGREVTLRGRKLLASYECRRFIADTEIAESAGATVTTNRLYGT